MQARYRPRVKWHIPEARLEQTRRTLSPQAKYLFIDGLLLNCAEVDFAFGAAKPRMLAQSLTRHNEESLTWSMITIDFDQLFGCRKYLTNT
ncbi:hypothetical protein [Billgrantia lactosivorans]|uniref:hypothetical protein n=1 Tax=Billgrantia lactosivorans TaxID=2185141 RepID=UPI0013A6D7C4|nr:hypothetical protein [Halomonas lactosivorans]